MSQNVLKNSLKLGKRGPLFIQHPVPTLNKLIHSKNQTKPFNILEQLWTIEENPDETYFLTNKKHEKCWKYYSTRWSLPRFCNEVDSKYYTFCHTWSPWQAL